MPYYPYLIIGGGMTADAAIHGIRDVDADRAIGVVGDEPDPPYGRPPLSKALWKGEPIESIWRTPAPGGVEWHLGRRIRALDVARKEATDDQGNVYTFDKCLLATGVTPRRLPFGGDQIIYYRTLGDYRRLRTLTEHGERFAVIGGGFIGSEVAAALAMNQKRVTMVIPETGIGTRIYPASLVHFVSTYYRQRGVEVLIHASAVGLETRNEKLVLKVRTANPSEEREIVVDGVIAGIGVQPNVALAQEAGLTVDNGIVVDENLRTDNPDVYAAGDVARFFNPALGQRMRVEHEDNANTMGHAAGRAMAGQAEPYHHLPFFYSDLFDLGYEAVGELDSRLQTVEDWQEPYRAGSVYYLRDGRVRGVLLWNLWGQVDPARALIAEAGPFQPSDLKGRLPAPQ
ncbi:MAG TPA: FAD-dependent oxidoreductase [Chloroflexota bacterium]|nr:FAD-dependent oxidoreductase [Chloroflexota bacterium]